VVEENSVGVVTVENGRSKCKFFILRFFRGENLENEDVEDDEEVDEDGKEVVG